jgi:hypothetical protein
MTTEQISLVFYIAGSMCFLVGAMCLLVGSVLSLWFK